MDDIDYEGKCTRLQPGQSSTGLQGVLFVDGFSECGVEFHLNALLKLPWPDTDKYLLKFDRQSPAFLAEILEHNTFAMIVIPALVRSFEEQYIEYIGLGRKVLKQQKPHLDRVMAALKSSVEQKGATLVLFCCERAGWIYKDLFGKNWERDNYVRTDCFRTKGAAAAIPRGPAVVNAKAVHLVDVPPEEQWYVSTEGSINNSILFQAMNTTGPPTGAGLCSIAAGKAGSGSVLYCGDVNAELESCQVVAHLAHALFTSDSERARQQTAHRAFAPMWER